MHNAGVSGVAVVDRDRRFLVGTLSVSDVRIIHSAVALSALAGPHPLNAHAVLSLFAPSVPVQRYSPHRVAQPLL
jgi:hypothetical protein